MKYYEMMSNALLKQNWESKINIVRDIVENSLMRKNFLIEVLNKHPSWDDENLCVKMVKAMPNTFDEDVVRYFFDFCIDPLLVELPRESIHESNILKKVALTGNKYLESDNINYIESYLGCNGLGFKIRRGIRMVSVIDKWCKKYKLDEKIPHYGCEFNKLANTYGNASENRLFILTVNPADIILSGVGNSWVTCQNSDRFEHQGHMSGAMSYIMDSVTLMLRITKTQTRENLWETPSLMRQFFHYDGVKLIQARLYPDHRMKDQITLNREFVQSVLDPDIQWKVIDDFDVIQEHVATHLQSTHFPDYNCRSSQKWQLPIGHTLSFNEEIDIDNYPRMVIGNGIPCIECGKTHLNKTSLVCCLNRIKCCQCGRDITEKDRYDSSEGLVCRNCVEECEMCHDDPATYTMIDHDGREIKICYTCKQNYSSYCYRCHRHVHDDIFDAESDLCLECKEKREQGE